MVNSEKSNRYIQVNIINGKIDIDNFKIVKQSSIPLDVIELSFNFFKLNKSLLDNGVLTSTQKQNYINKYKDSKKNIFS